MAGQPIIGMTASLGHSVKIPGVAMKLNATQTRRLTLAGALPFPTPFPSIGKISIERIKLTFSRSTTKRKLFIVIRDRRSDMLTRLTPLQGVAAIFFPGHWVKTRKAGRVFRFSKQHAVHNFENGEWFLRPEISVDAIRAKLGRPKLSLEKRDNPARGIVFVYKDRPIMTVTEVVQLAGDINPSRDSRNTIDAELDFRDGCDPDVSDFVYDGCDPKESGIGFDGCDPKR
jgi:hypothetical protein